jgi:hypothetical protein
MCSYDVVYSQLLHVALSYYHFISECLLNNKNTISGDAVNCL